MCVLGGESVCVGGMGGLMAATCLILFYIRISYLPRGLGTVAHLSV